MIEAAEIERLSTSEKIHLMEVLWEGLSALPENLEMPEWHDTLLEAREKQAASGEAKWIDWETAKRELRNSAE